MKRKLLALPTRQRHVGQHLILDAWRAPSDLLNDPHHVRESLIQAVDSSGATLVDLCIHQFSPYGVTATATLAESHIAIHTWPENGYLGADLFFCGAGRPELALDVLVKLFQAKETKIRRLNRGIRPEAAADDLLGETGESA